MKVLENYQKSIFSSVSFKKFELSSPPTYIYIPKTDTTASVSFVYSKNFKIPGRVSAVESRFIKVTETCVLRLCREI